MSTSLGLTPVPHTPIPKQLADINNQPLHGHCREHDTVPARGSGATNHPSDMPLLQILSWISPDPLKTSQ